jgi:AbrB family looped-hinge helix DNA binding protein
MRAVLSEKGQFTIPKAARDRLDLQAGQILEVQIENGTLIVRKVVTVDPVAAVFGVLRGQRSTDEIMTELRGPADP